MGNLFFRKNQIDRAVESFKSSLELAKKVYPGQLKLVGILNNLASALQQDGKLDKSLRYYKEAKEILDNHTEVGNLTVAVLNNIGHCYVKLKKYLLAFHSYKDALDNLGITMISGKRYTLYEDMAAVVLVLSVKNIRDIIKFDLSKERKAVERDRERALNQRYMPCYC